MKDYNDLTARLRSAAVEEGMERRQLLLCASGAIDEMQKELTPYKEAEANDRLVVLPCKVGDTVYAVGNGQYKRCDIDEACVDHKGEVVFNVSFTCDDNCDGCPFNNWHQDYSGEYSCDGEWSQAAINAEDFGKTVFLTREAAEAALQNMEGST